MYRKILLGLLVSTAAIHAMESSEDLLKQRILNAYKMGLDEATKQPNPYKKESIQQKGMDALLSSLQPDELQKIKSHEFIAKFPMDSQQQISNLIKKFKPTDAVKKLGQVNLIRNAQSQVDQSWKKKDHEKHVKHEEEEKKYSSDGVVPAQLSIPDITNLSTSDTLSQPKKIEIPAAFLKSSKKSTAERTSSHQSGIHQQDTSSVSSPRMDQQPSSDAQVISVELQQDLEALRDPKFMEKLQHAIKELLKKYENQAEKEREVHDLEEQLSRVKFELEEAEKKIHEGDESLNIVRLQIASFIMDFTHFVSHEDKKRFENDVNSLKKDPTLLVDKTIFENLDKINCDPVVLDRINSLLNDSADLVLKKYISDFGVAIKTIKVALENYHQAEEQMNKLREDMVDIVNKTNSLGQ